MKIGVIAKDGRCAPFRGRIREVETRYGPAQTFQMNRAPLLCGIRMHLTTPPELISHQHDVQLDRAAVQVFGRNIVVASRDDGKSDDDFLLGFKMPLPGSHFLKGKRPVEIYDQTGTFCSQRLFCDAGKTVRYQSGPVFTLWGFLTIRLGETGRLYSVRADGGIGEWLISNVNGEFLSTWSAITES